MKPLCDLIRCLPRNATVRTHATRISPIYWAFPSLLALIPADAYSACNATCGSKTAGDRPGCVLTVRGAGWEIAIYDV